MDTTTTTTTGTTTTGAAPAVTSPPPKTVWPCVNFADAHAGIRFLTDTLGFELRAIHGDDGELIVHSELIWPEGGGVMCGSAGRNDSEFSAKPTGAASVYVVTDHPDEVYARATAGGAEVVRELRDEDYGSRGFTVTDAEGNLWSFGTYRGE